jgi:tRNA dimethylallyltransferase
MNKAKKKLIVILGPTASGKTKLAVALAKKFDGEIISADSRQVYQGMDIGSGKDLNEYGNIPYHLIDVASPKKQFSLAKYQKQANKAIDDCFKRGRQPFLVGGSGLYLNAIIYGFVLSKSKPNLMLRKSLNQKTLAELQQLILKNKICLNDSDFRNKRRLIRKLEIFEQPQAKNTFERNPHYNCLILGVKPDTAEELLNNITKRLDFRLQKQGLVEEVENLKKSGLS